MILGGRSRPAVDSWLPWSTARICIRFIPPPPPPPPPTPSPNPHPHPTPQPPHTHDRRVEHHLRQAGQVRRQRRQDCAVALRHRRPGHPVLCRPRHLLRGAGEARRPASQPARQQASRQLRRPWLPLLCCSSSSVRVSRCAGGSERAVMPCMLPMPFPAGPATPRVRQPGPHQAPASALSMLRHPRWPWAPMCPPARLDPQLNKNKKQPPPPTHPP